MRDIVISAAVSVLIITFLYQPVRVEGTSMLPRLEDHDRLFINKFVYRISSIHRGDVVVFHYPRDPEKSYIKRVIAAARRSHLASNADGFISTAGCCMSRMCLRSTAIRGPWRRRWFPKTRTS